MGDIIRTALLWDISNKGRISKGRIMDLSREGTMMIAEEVVVVSWRQC